MHTVRSNVCAINEVPLRRVTAVSTVSVPLQLPVMTGNREVGEVGVAAQWLPLGVGTFYRQESHTMRCLGDGPVLTYASSLIAFSGSRTGEVQSDWLA